MTYSIMIYPLQFQGLVAIAISVGLYGHSDQIGFQVSASDPYYIAFSVLVMSCIPFWILILCVKKLRFLGWAAIALANPLFIDLKDKCITALEVGL